VGTKTSLTPLYKAGNKNSKEIFKKHTNNSSCVLICRYCSLEVDKPQRQYYALANDKVDLRLLAGSLTAFGDYVGWDGNNGS
jgi:hypothetical protein